MRAIWIVPVIASILILGTLGISQDAFAFTQGVCGQTIIASVTLTANILNCPLSGIIVGADNIVLDGDGHTIDGAGAGFQVGVGLFDRTGVTVKNLAVTDFSSGIFLNISNDNTLRDNTVSSISLLRSNDNTLRDNTIVSRIFLNISNDNTLRDNTVNAGGISLSTSERNTLSGNAMAENFSVGGNFARFYVHFIDTTNTVDGKPIFYLLNQNDVTIDASSNAGYVAAVRSTNILVKDLTLSNNGQGVLFASTTNSVIQNVVVSGNTFGISLAFSDGNTVTGNTATDNVRGIVLQFSDENTVTGNTATDNSLFGIGLLSGADRNLVTSNTVTGSTFGIGVQSSNFNTVTDNSVSENDIGIRVGFIQFNADVFFAGGDGNTLELNTVMNNEVGIKVSDSSSTIVKDNTVTGSTLEGILLFSSDGSVLNSNEINGNAVGIKLFLSDKNKVRFNTLVGNTDCIIELESSMNLFIRNTCVV